MGRKQKPVIRDVEKQKKINVLKNMYFNRYLMIRYFFALFLFSNFYWALFTQGMLIMIIPICMVLLGIPPCIEIIRCYGEISISMKWTKLFYRCQICINACLMVVTCSGLFHHVIPFLHDTLSTRIAFFMISLIGFIIAYACAMRLSKIENNKDRYFTLIKNYEKSLHLHL